MPGPPIPASFESLGRRPFSFYPPIVNVEHNEWILRRANWTDFQVINTKTKDELCVPRRFVGEGALVEEPVMIVGLVKELEYREGVVCRTSAASLRCRVLSTRARRAAQSGRRASRPWSEFASKPSPDRELGAYS